MFSLVKLYSRQFHLRAVHYLKAHADKDILYLVQHIVHWVLMTQMHLFPRHGHVQSLIPEFLFHHCGAELSFALLNDVFNIASQLVCQLAHGGTFFGGEAAHLAEDGGELALFTQILDSQSLQALSAVRFKDSLDGTTP